MRSDELEVVEACFATTVAEAIPFSEESILPKFLGERREAESPLAKVGNLGISGIIQ
jgi:hypothetical protein